jgi:hypothetical protein
MLLTLLIIRFTTIKAPQPSLEPTALPQQVNATASIFRAPIA